MRSVLYTILFFPVLALHWVVNSLDTVGLILAGALLLRLAWWRRRSRPAKASVTGAGFPRGSTAGLLTLSLLTLGGDAFMKRAPSHVRIPLSWSRVAAERRVDGISTDVLYQRWRVPHAASRTLTVARTWRAPVGDWTHAAEIRASDLLTRILAVAPAGLPPAVGGPAAGPRTWLERTVEDEARRLREREQLERSLLAERRRERPSSSPLPTPFDRAWVDALLPLQSSPGTPHRPIPTDADWIWLERASDAVNYSLRIRVIETGSEASVVELWSCWSRD